MSPCGTYWKARYFMVCEQTCCGDDMDKSMWQTFGAFDLLHLFHTSEFRQYCHVGNTAQQCRIGLIISRFWFCRRPGSFKNNIRWFFVYFWKSNICTNKLKASLFCPMLYILEDNEAVIKMIIKGWSPTMRHVSRTHRVALDWLFDRINLDPRFRTRYIDTKRQVADILTQGNFTRDERNNLLHLFNISHFSSACFTNNFSLISCPKQMAKRVKEQKEEERIVATSTPRPMNLSSTFPARSSSAKNLITSSDPEKLITAGKHASRTRRNSRPDEVSSSQVKLKDVCFGRLTALGNLSQPRRIRYYGNSLNLNLGAFTRMK